MGVGKIGSVLSSSMHAGNTSSRRLNVVIRCGVYNIARGWYRPRCYRCCSCRWCTVRQHATPGPKPSVTIDRSPHGGMFARPLSGTRRKGALPSGRPLLSVHIREELVSRHSTLQQVCKRELPRIHAPAHLPTGRRDERLILLESKVRAEVRDVPVLNPRQTARNKLDTARAGPADESKGAGHAPGPFTAQNWVRRRLWAAREGRPRGRNG